MSSLSLSVLKIRDFRLLVLARVFITTALKAQAIIVGWQIYSITKDPFMLGLTGLVEAAPAISCALFCGVIVDTSRPHRVYIIATIALLLNTLMLLLIAGGVVSLHETNIIIWIFTGIFISGMARSFFSPSSFSLFPEIVPRSQTAAGSAWMSSGFQLSAICGPAIAGLIYGGYGVLAAWMFPMGLVTAAIFMLYGLSKPLHSYKSSHAREPFVESTRKGWGFILKNPIMLSVMALDMFAVLLGGAVSMLPAFADQILHVGSEGLGALSAAPAIGAIVIALWLAIRPMKKIRGTTLLWVIAGFGACMIGFGLSRVFWLSLFFLVMSGAFDSISMVIRGTIMQLLTPDNMRGRVSSVSSMFIISSNEIGAFESGLAAKLLGLVPSVVLGGIGTIIVVIATAIMAPDLRKAVINPDDAGNK
jgi:MFS family permease